MRTNVNTYVHTMTQTVCLTLWCVTRTRVPCLGIQLSDLTILVRLPRTKIRQSVLSLTEKSDWTNPFVYDSSIKRLKQALLIQLKKALESSGYLRYLKGINL